MSTVRSELFPTWGDAMKSSRYYARKADALRECGYWAMADEMERMARRKRASEKKQKRRNTKDTP